MNFCATFNIFPFSLTLLLLCFCRSGKSKHTWKNARNMTSQWELCVGMCVWVCMCAKYIMTATKKRTKTSCRYTPLTLSSRVCRILSRLGLAKSWVVLHLNGARQPSKQCTQRGVAEEAAGLRATRSQSTHSCAALYNHITQACQLGAAVTQL